MRSTPWHAPSGSTLHPNLAWRFGSRSYEQGELGVLCQKLYSANIPEVRTSQTPPLEWRHNMWSDVNWTAPVLTANGLDLGALYNTYGQSLQLQNGSRHLTAKASSIVPGCEHSTRPPPCSMATFCTTLCILATLFYNLCFPTTIFYVSKANRTQRIVCH